MAFNDLNEVFLLNIKYFNEVKTEFKWLKQSFFKSLVKRHAMQ
jgi:hypothetical protein